MRSPIAVLAVFVSSLAALIAGCGGTSGNGVADKSPDAIVAAATNAIRGVKSVHVSGSLVSEGTPVTLDLNLVAGRGGSGRMSQSGLDFQLIVLDQAAYINGSDAFWRHAGGGEAAQLLGGKWLKMPATGQFGSLTALADVQTLFDKLLSNHGKLKKGRISRIGGQQVVAVTDPSKGATLYVATTGKPYPVEILKTGPEGGHLVFDRYDEPVSLQAPAQSVNLSKLE